MQDSHTVESAAETTAVSSPQLALALERATAQAPGLLDLPAAVAGCP